MVSMSNLQPPWQGFGGVITLIAAILVFVACSKKQPVLMLPMIILAVGITHFFFVKTRD